MESWNDTKTENEMYTETKISAETATKTESVGSLIDTEMHTRGG